MTLEEWLDIVTAAENMIKVRRGGFVYLESSKFETAQMLLSRVDIDLMDWINRYFDYDFYN